MIWIRNIGLCFQSIPIDRKQKNIIECLVCRQKAKPKFIFVVVISVIVLLCYFDVFVSKTKQTVVFLDPSKRERSKSL